MPKSPMVSRENPDYVEALMALTLPMTRSSIHISSVSLARKHRIPLRHRHHLSIVPLSRSSPCHDLCLRPASLHSSVAQILMVLFGSRGVDIGRLLLTFLLTPEIALRSVGSVVVVTSAQHI